MRCLGNPRGHPSPHPVVPVPRSSGLTKSLLGRSADCAGRGAEEKSCRLAPPPPPAFPREG